MGLFLPLYSIVPCPSLWKFSYMIKCFFSCSNHKGPTVPPGFVFTIYHISFCHFKLIITLWEEIMCRKTFMYICTHIYTQYLKYINQISVEIYKKIFNQITWNLQKKFIRNEYILAWTFKYFVPYFWIVFGSLHGEFQQIWEWILILW